MSGLTLKHEQDGLTQNFDDGFGPLPRDLRDARITTAAKSDESEQPEPTFFAFWD